MKQFILKSFLLISITILPLMLINYIVDPLQCFRPATWYKPLYDSNERVQSACLARSYQYDNIIIGASHSENFDPIEMDEIFRGKTLKLALAGSTLNEQQMVFNLALNTGQVKNVIWGVETNILNDDPNRVRDDIIKFPYHIYQPNLINNVKFLLDPYLIKHYVKIFLHEFFGKYDEYADLRYLNNWSHLFIFSKQRVLEIYNEIQTSGTRVMENDNLNNQNYSTANLDQNIIKIIKGNPNVHFIIFFPPHSILRWVDLYDRNPAEFNQELELKKYLISKLIGMDNTSLFDFQSAEDVIYDLDNYKDLTHFSPRITEYIIDNFKSGGYSVSPNNISSSVESIKKQVAGFKMSKLK